VSFTSRHTLPGEALLVTVQRCAGKTPHALRREAEAARDASRAALENCRLLAARHRPDTWAQAVLRFCAEGGAIGSPLRADSTETPTS
jgi:hypothetical protein